MLHQLGTARIFSVFSDVKISDSIHLSPSHLASAMKKLSSLRHKDMFSFSFCVSLLSAVSSAALLSLETQVCCSSREAALLGCSAVHFFPLPSCWASGVFGRGCVMDKRTSSVPVLGTVFDHAGKSPSKGLAVVLGQAFATSTFIPKDKLKGTCQNCLCC